MGKLFDRIEPAHADLIARQHIFFTATVAAGARINISPRPTDCLRVLSPNQVAYRDLTGSGSETAAHLRADGRMTIMFCTFAGPPTILRLYGQGRHFPTGTETFHALLAGSFGNEEPPGTRQIVVLDIESVQTSCGFGVPLFDFRAHRESLARWTEQKGEAGLRAYRRDKNRKSLDGLPSLDSLT